MSRPFSPRGRVATTHTSNQILGDDIEFPALPRQNTNSAICGSIERMVRLKSADQDVRVYKHALNAAWIDDLAADGLLT